MDTLFITEEMYDDITVVKLSQHKWVVRKREKTAESNIINTRYYDTQRMLCSLHPSYPSNNTVPVLVKDVAWFLQLFAQRCQANSDTSNKLQYKAAAVIKAQVEAKKNKED